MRIVRAAATSAKTFGNKLALLIIIEMLIVAPPARRHAV
jgi:hypothetical protein